MANRSLRRAPSRAELAPVLVDEPVREYVHSTVIESGTEPDTDSSSGGNDNEPVSVSDSPKRIGVIEIDPNELDSVIRERSDNRDDSGGKRTRKPRSDNGVKRGRKSRKEAPQNVEALVTMVHTWAAVLLKTPELMLDQSEVKQLNAAYETFSEHHEVPLISPKRLSEINLIGAMCMIYGTRFVAVSKRKKEARKLHVMPSGQRATN